MFCSPLLAKNVNTEVLKIKVLREFLCRKTSRLKSRDRQRVFEKRAFRKLFGTKSLENTAQWGVPNFIIRQIFISSALRW